MDFSQFRVPQWFQILLCIKKESIIQREGTEDPENCTLSIFRTPEKLRKWFETTSPFVCAWTDKKSVVTFFLRPLQQRNSSLRSAPIRCCLPMIIIDVNNLHQPTSLGILKMSFHQKHSQKKTALKKMEVTVRTIPCGRQARSLIVLFVDKYCYTSNAILHF